uniref:Uncharacterized protein n=1 Tax=Aegilops tauschii subsp. strangulata TaxID=200361 RepID=A0A453M4G4_AEGTS
MMEITKMGSRVASHPVHQDAQVQNQNNLLQAQQVGNFCWLPYFMLCIHCLPFFSYHFCT